MEGSVDARCDARRRDDLAVVHDADAFADGGPRGHLPQHVDGSVVRRRRQAVEQSGLRQQQRPGADRQDDFGLHCRPPDPANQGFVVRLLAGAQATGNYEEVRGRAVGQQVVGIDAEAVLGEQRPPLLGHRVDVEGGRLGPPACDRKDLEGAGKIEKFHVGEEQDGDVPGGGHDLGPRERNEESRRGPRRRPINENPRAGQG